MVTEEEQYLYTRPLTLGELVYAVSTGDGKSSKYSYDYVLKIDSLFEFAINEYQIKMPNPMRRKFYLEGLIKNSDELEKIEVAMSTGWDPQYYAYTKKKSKLAEKYEVANTIKRFNKHADRFTPRNILKNKFEKRITDCKGKAILAVAFFRSINVPTKLANNSYHVFIERWYNSEEWLFFDPEYLFHTTKLAPVRDANFDEYYKKVISHFDNVT